MQDAAGNSESAQSRSGTDFDLHGIVGIRLIDPTPGDVRAVRKQLGPIDAPLARTPDITIRFVDKLETTGAIQYLGLDEAGFTDDAFLILNHKHKSVRVRIPFEQIGGRCEIVCERGIPAVPLLVPIINLTALSNGFVPLHAAAFHYHGRGVLVTGWSKGGKTEMLLGFLARGAEYIGDEWVYISGEERRMFGIPEPIRMWDWHLTDLPEFRALLSFSERARLKVLSAVTSAIGMFAGPNRPLHKISAFRKLLDLFKRQIFVDVDPQRLFGRKLTLMRGTVDDLLFVVSHDLPKTEARAVSSSEVAERMLASLDYEEREFLRHYRMAQFAFPSLSNSMIENARAQRREILNKSLADVPAHAVYHPYPAQIPSLVGSVEPLLRQPSKSSPQKNQPTEPLRTGGIAK
ncbi:MAG: hypothetical protein AB7O26_10720 [Planctomycetaceae bacterium]